jgi:hypothetical protein
MASVRMPAHHATPAPLSMGVLPLLPPLRLLRRLFAACRWSL